jgi:hypothetical protein
MAARETDLRAALKLPNSLIARTATTPRITRNEQRTTNNRRPATSKAVRA